MGWRRHVTARLRRVLGIDRRRAQRAAVDQALAEIAAGLSCYSAGSKDLHLKRAEGALRGAWPQATRPGCHPYIQPGYSDEKPVCAVCGREAADPIHGPSAGGTIVTRAAAE
jgi:hypothetical protein